MKLLQLRMCEKESIHSLQSHLDLDVDIQHVHFGSPSRRNTIHAVFSMYKVEVVEALENGLGDFAKESRSEAEVLKGELSITVGERVIVGGY